jgi:hypothetical protein
VRQKRIDPGWNQHVDMYQRASAAWFDLVKLMKELTCFVDFLHPRWYQLRYIERYGIAMRENKSFRIRLALAALVTVIGVCRVAVADDVASGGVGASGPSPERGVAVAGWLLYPQLFVGGMVNDNVTQSARAKQTGYGPRITPSFDARYDTGIHELDVYGAVDGQFYPTKSSNDLIQARAGVSDTYQVTPDVSVNGLLDYTRQMGLGSALGLGVGPVITSSNAAAQASSQIYNQYTGSISVLDRFDRLFFQPSATVQSTTYESLRNVAAAQDSTATGLGLRIGYAVGPSLNAFVEPSYQMRDYRRSGLNTDGYRLVAGLSSDRIGLFSGEIHGGYQSQSGASAINGSVGGYVLGGAIYYYPLEYLTFSLSADQALGSYGDLSAISAASYTRGAQYGFDADYKLASYWSAHARVAYAENKLVGSRGQNSAMVAGFSLSYTFWRNIAVTGEYQYARQWSNVPNTSWDQNMITLGLTYSY